MKSSKQTHCRLKRVSLGQVCFVVPADWENADVAKVSYVALHS